jgi:hypothetical protein
VTFRRFFGGKNQTEITKLRKAKPMKREKTENLQHTRSKHAKRPSKHHDKSGNGEKSWF